MNSVFGAVVIESNGDKTLNRRNKICLWEFLLEIDYKRNTKPMLQLVRECKIDRKTSPSDCNRITETEESLKIGSHADFYG